MILSVIIPTYLNTNRTPDRLLLSMAGFLHQKLDNDCFELIIVNDGSDMDIENYLRNNLGCLPNLRVINKNHTGMCSSINLGVEYAKGDYVLIGVDDNVPSYYSLYNLYQEIRNDDFDERFVYIGREYFLLHVTGIKNILETKYYKGIDTVDYKKKYQKELELFPTISIDDVVNRFDDLLSIAEEPEINKQFSNLLQNQSKTAYHWLCLRPGALALSMKTFKQLNGFDENFDPSGWYSDLEFGYRLINNKNQMKYINDFSMIHLNHIRIDCSPKVENQCFEYMMKKYNSIDLAVLPFLWMDSKLDVFIQYAERIKKHITI